MKTILKPALHTLWQAFAASLVLWFTANAAEVHAVHTVGDAERVGLSAAAAVGAAVLSALFHLIKQYGPALAASRAKDNPTEAAAIYAALTAADTESAKLADYTLPASAGEQGPEVPATPPTA